METSFQQNAVHPCSFLKADFTTGIFFSWVLQGTFFKNFENFSARYHSIPFVQEVASLLKINYLEYKVHVYICISII